MALPGIPTIHPVSHRIPISCANRMNSFRQLFIIGRREFHSWVSLAPH
jgi:hypothetical protein